MTFSESTVASQEELQAHQVPLGWRDKCSALLIPLNLCRVDKWYLPWECQEQRHAYEECQYKDYMRRMKHLAELRKEAGTSEE